MKNVSDLYFTSNEYRGMLGDLLIENQKVRTKEGRSDPWKYSLTVEQQEKLNEFSRRHSDLIHSTVRSLQLQGMITNGKVSSIFLARAHDIKEGERMRGAQWSWNTLYGKPLHLDESNHSILLGQSLGHVLGCKPVKKQIVMDRSGGYIAQDRPFECETGDVQLSMSTESGQINAIDLPVLGLVDAGYQEIDNKYIMIPLEVGQMLSNTKKISFQTFLLNDRKDLPKFLSLFESEIRSTEPDLSAVPWQQHIVGEIYKRTMELLNIFRNFVIIVIILISTLSVFNTLIKIVKERTREIGTLRSIGFQSKQVLDIFVLEALFLSMFGLLFGFVLTWIASTALNSSSISYRAGLLSEPVLFQVTLSPTTMLIVAGSLMILSMLASYMTCVSTVRKKIVDCLNHA